MERPWRRKDPFDPRDEDLKEDHSLWLTLLERFWRINKNIYFIFHGLRCGGSHLKLKGDKINFIFSEEFNNDFITKIKKKYLNPNQDIIQIVMNKLSKDLSNSSEKTLKECPF